METRLAKEYLSLRKATESDAADLAALHAESFGAAKWSLAQIAGSLALKTTLSPMAREGKTARGFMLCQIAGDQAEILTFCVSPSARRKGMGTLLLNVTIEAARQRQVKRMFLEVGADNKAAVALYENAGFRVTGKRAGYYKHGGTNVDAVTMALDL